MTTTQITETGKTNDKCDGCNDYDNDAKHPLTKRTWTHYDYDTGWAYEEGERVRGHYCPSCLASIVLIETSHAEEEENEQEPTLEDWAELACRLAMGMTRAFSNWKDVSCVTKREMKMLTEQMGEDWQRKW